VKRITFLGLGGNSWGPLLAGLYFQHAHPDAQLLLVDGKEYRHGHEDHEFFLRTGPKPLVQAALLHSAYPSLVTIPVCEFLDRETTARTIEIADVVCDGDYVVMVVDNHETRRLVADHAMTLPNVTLISGAIDGTRVGIWVHLRRGGRDLMPSPLVRYPDIASAPTGLPGEMFRRTGCLEEGLAHTEPQEERPNYFALLTTTALTLNALWLAIELDAKGRIETFPYVDTWLNVRTATATSNNKGDVAYGSHQIPRTSS
jgi:hypothetical protein